jgi:hypothetical protein
VRQVRVGGLTGSHLRSSLVIPVREQNGKRGATWR